MPRLFLLSPASCRGERIRLLTGEGARSDLARALRLPGGASLGDVFAFLSSLYFRGKLRYAETFANPPAGLPGVLVITPRDGLLSPQTRISADALHRWASIPVHPDDPRYTTPLDRDAGRLAAALAGSTCDVVLLGSIATAKYVEPLARALGSRLRFPTAFVGRGDMSRGGLLLRHAAAGRELDYVPVAGAVRHGARPARLPRRSLRAEPE